MDKNYDVNINLQILSIVKILCCLGAFLWKYVLFCVNETRCSVFYNLKYNLSSCPIIVRGIFFFNENKLQHISCCKFIFRLQQLNNKGRLGDK